MWLIVVLMLVGAVVLFTMKKPLELQGVRANLGAPVACPSCGNFFASAAGGAGTIVRCTECQKYSQLDATGTPTAIAPDHVASKHAFQTYLPEAPRWPACCCVCTAPATRQEKMQITYAAEPTFEEKLTAHAITGAASLGAVRVAEHHVNVTERYSVPHCNEHGGGALLVPAGVAFRSFAYYQQFVQANRAAG
ncbi:MAG TPA: hypothetical protein VIV11_38715 [Kofleriaceae bacterium]